MDKTAQKDKNAIYGYFRNNEMVDRAVSLLRDSDLQPANASLLLLDRMGMQIFSQKLKSRIPQIARRGAVYGAIIGAFLGWILGVSMDVGLDATGSALVGVGVGVVIGILLNVMVSAGVSENNFNHFEDHHPNGSGVVLMVESDKSDTIRKVRKVLTDSGASGIVTTNQRVDLPEDEHIRKMDIAV